MRAPRDLPGSGGFALVTVLVFLAVLMLIGVGGMSVGTMQEKMAGNGRDADVAFQAAEAALRDAEADVARNINAGSNFTNTCTNGLCVPAALWATPQAAPVWTTIDWTNGGVTRSYGVYTGKPALPRVAAQPVYIVERLSVTGGVVGESAAIGLRPPPAGQLYRITVYATGARPETHTMLQTVYAKR